MLLAIPGVQSGLSEFFEFIWSGFVDIEVGSGHARLLSWFQAFQVFLDHPILGVGIQGYGPEMHARGYYLDRPAEQVRTTMLYLEILAEFGLVGFTLFIWWVFYPIIKLWEYRNDEFVSGVVSALLSMVIMFPFIQNWWRPYLWIAWVMAYSLCYFYNNK